MCSGDQEWCKCFLKCPASGVGMSAAVCWFRKGLRVHDNPALARAVAHAVESGGVVHPLFIVDPHFGPGKVSAGTTFSSVRA